MGWTNSQTESLTLPPGSTGAPRIFIGSGDPFAAAAGALAAIMFYWESDEAFMLWVDEVAPVGFLQLANTDATGIVAVYATMTYNEVTGDAVLTLGDVTTGVVNVDTSDFQIDGVSQGRGNRTVGRITANSAAIGAETVVITIGSATYKAGRAFACNVAGRVQASAANNSLFRLRAGTTTAGTLIATFGAVPATAAGSPPPVNLTRYLKVDSADPDFVSAFVLTLAASAGTSTLLAAANEPAYMEIVDAGDQNDFTHAIFL